MRIRDSLRRAPSPVFGLVGAAGFVVLIGCFEGDEPLGLTDPSLEPQFDHHCQTFLGEDCYVVNYIADEQESSVAFEYSPNGDPSDPLWQGETVVVEGAYVCPPMYPRPTWRVQVEPNWESLYFQALGTGYLDISIYIPPDGNVPRAAYTVPPGQHPDLTRRYRAEGGHVHARCFVRRAYTPTGRMAYVGPIVTYNYTGVVYANESQNGPNGGRGWAYKDVQVENGVGDGWQNALDTFLNGGGCTPGWEIWVDGVMRCDSNGNYYA